jgi:hypothetical protein
MSFFFTVPRVLPCGVPLDLVALLELLLGHHAPPSGMIA